MNAWLVGLGLGLLFIVLPIILFLWMEAPA